MRHFYMDTNVFISSIKPNDPVYVDARSIVKGLAKGEVQASTSVISLLEVASVSVRLYLSKFGESTTQRGINAFTIRTLRNLAKLVTRFVHIKGDSPISISGITAELPSVINAAFILSFRARLRSLDLVHLAAARHGKFLDSELGAFVTGDASFLSGKQRLSKILNMPILSPGEYVRVVGLEK